MDASADANHSSCNGAIQIILIESHAVIGAAVQRYCLDIVGVEVVSIVSSISEALLTLERIPAQEDATMRKVLARTIPYVVAATLVVSFIVWHVGSASAGQAAPPAPTGGPMLAIPITQPGKTPAYTVDDVRAFIASHPGGDLTTASGAPFSIDDVRFVTREEAEQMTRGESLEGQVAPGELVCIVSLTGPFSNNAISIMANAPRPQDHPTYAAVIFDAHSGTLLSEWFHN